MTPPSPHSVPSEILAGRRQAAARRLGGGVLVLPAGPVQHSSRDSERPYVADRELYYLTGLVEPESVAVLVGGNEPRLIVFVRERDADAELWAGPRLGPEGALEVSGADEAHPISELDRMLPALVRGADRLHFRLGRGGPVEGLVLAALREGRRRGPRLGDGPRGIVDPGETLDDLRLIKDEHEIDVLRQACTITVEGHLRGAAAIGPGVGEWAIEAAIDGAFRSAGARGPGYETIVGSGVNACVLHYVRNADRVPEDGLVLVDAGAEYGLYNGDVTRTWPVGGRFSDRQREVYDLVEAALAEGVSTARPGATIGEVHDRVTRTLVDGLIRLGVLSGEADGLIEQGAHKPFYPHQTSHWLGLDVHDPGDYAREGASRTLEPGMVFTVEPGLYFRPALSEDGAEPFSGIGVRIEDDVLITESGCEVLTGALPTAAGQVEELVRGV